MEYAVDSGDKPHKEGLSSVRNLVNSFQILITFLKNENNTHSARRGSPPFYGEQSQLCQLAEKQTRDNHSSRGVGRTAAERCADGSASHLHNKQGR